MDNPAEPNQIVQHAKLAYLLASCKKFNDACMATMVKQYANKVAMRYYFTFYINLHELDDTPDQFAVKDVHFKFDNSDELILKTAIQAHNNEMLSWEMKVIYDNLKEQDIDLNITQLIGVYAIAALVKTYKHRERYSFVPVIINYGRNANMVHQTALIIDHKRQTFIYYEPYGAYSKYGKSYRECVQRFFNIFTNIKLFNDSTDNVKSVIYHRIFGLPKGIQTIALEKNNACADEANIHYAKTLDLLSKNFSKCMSADELIKLREHTNDDKSSNDDKNLKILMLLVQVERLGLKQMTDEKALLYKKLLHDSLEQFYWYNAKTCVSITLVEMNEFFAGDSTDESYQMKSSRLNKFYGEFDVARPNKILMTKINDLMGIFNESNVIHEAIADNLQSFKICGALYKN